jgi:hypothetical protein
LLTDTEKRNVTWQRFKPTTIRSETQHFANTLPSPLGEKQSPNYHHNVIIKSNHHHSGINKQQDTIQDSRQQEPNTNTGVI